MKRIILLISIVVMGLVSCSTPSKRLKVVKPLGDVIWRQHEFLQDKSEIYLIADKDSMLMIVMVTSNGRIFKIIKLDKKVIKYK